MLAKTNFVANPLDNLPQEEHIEYFMWEAQTPQTGDHIRVSRGVYNHHGIYISDEEIIHFSGDGDDNILGGNNTVCTTTLAKFTQNGKLEVRLYTDEELDDLYSVSGIISYARQSLGESGYSVIYNNCEHFANMCTLGKFRSYQVDRLLNRKGKNKMGLFSWLFGSSKSSSSRSTSHSETKTIYEPDKVKIAEFEYDKAKLDNERVLLIGQVQKEILEAEKETRLAIEEAQARGFATMAQTIYLLQEKMTEIAQKRIEVIARGSLSIVRDFENYYHELETKIKLDNENYSETKLPKLLNMLDKYPEDSTAHKLFVKRIEDDMISQVEFMGKQITNLHQRQQLTLEQINRSSQHITEKADNISAELLANLNERISLNNPSASTTAKLGNSSAKLALDQAKPKQLK